MDEKTGYFVYSVSVPGHSQRLVVYDAEQEKAWELEMDDWFSLYKNEHGIIVSTNGRGNVLDLVNNRLVEKTFYTMSDDGMFGYTNRNYFERNIIKNFVTGEIWELPADRYANMRGWLGEGELLVNQYSTVHKQNVIYRYDAVANTMTEMFLGSIYWTHLNSNMFLYVQNEAARRLRLYNMVTGEERIVNWQEYTELFPIQEYSRDDVPDVSVILNPDALEQVPLSRQRENEHIVMVDGVGYPVSYVFWREDTQFIPVRDLLKPLDITFLMEEHGVNNKRFLLSRGDVTVVLTDADSTVYKERLFVTQNVLKTLGVVVEEINAVQ